MLCVICQKPVNQGSFCSKRCQMIDLNEWLSGHYSIPQKDEA